jgi:hypothetical protein
MASSWRRHGRAGTAIGPSVAMDATASSPKDQHPFRTPPALTNKLVWVNTESGVYQCPNSPDWGLTRRGRYLNEADAGAVGSALSKFLQGERQTGE